MNGVLKNETFCGLLFLIKTMLLSSKIKEEYIAKKIHIHPFVEKNIGTNSYDVHLGTHLRVYTDEILDCKKDHTTRLIEIPKEKGFLLKPGILYLGNTAEEIGSDYYIPAYDGRSSYARLGLQSHCTAGRGSIGFKSQWTLELSVVQPLIIYPNLKIGQIYFEVPHGEIEHYSGKYVGQKGPQSSKAHLDFKD